MNEEGGGRIGEGNRKAELDILLIWINTSIILVSKWHAEYSAWGSSSGASSSPPGPWKSCFVSSFNSSLLPGGSLGSSAPAVSFNGDDLSSIKALIDGLDFVSSNKRKDDFLPRTPTPLEHIFGSIFCLPCLLFLVCARDTFIPEEKLLRDPRRLYAPGRMFHIVERKPCSCGRMPPEVRTAIPVEGRFEHIVLSCNAVYDHSLVWIEREAQKALERMEGGYEAMIPPTQPIIARDQSHDKEHKDALEKAAQLTKEHHDLDGEIYKESYMPLDYDCNEMNFESELKSDQGDAVEKLLNDDRAEGLGR